MIARQAAHCALVVVAVVPVVAQAASMDDRSTPAAGAFHRRIGFLRRDLPPGSRANRGGAPSARGNGRVLLGFLMTDTLMCFAVEGEDHARRVAIATAA